MYLSAPPLLYALVLAVVSGSLLADDQYVAGAALGAIAVLLTSLWIRAVRRGEHHQDGLR